jgi:hypothetical protein
MGIKGSPTAQLIDEDNPNKSYLSAASTLVTSNTGMKVTTDSLQIMAT